MSERSHERMNPEAKAYAAVTRALDEVPRDAQIRILRHAEESTSRTSSATTLTTVANLACQVMDELGKMLTAIRSVVATCEHCGSTRLVDGKPCPFCFPLWELLPEAETRAKLLRGELPEVKA